MIQHLGYMHLWMPPAWPALALAIPFGIRLWEGWQRYCTAHNGG